MCYEMVINFFGDQFVGVVVVGVVVLVLIGWVGVQLCISCL